MHLIQLHTNIKGPKDKEKVLKAFKGYKSLVSFTIDYDNPKKLALIRIRKKESPKKIISIIKESGYNAWPAKKKGIIEYLLGYISRWFKIKVS